MLEALHYEFMRNAIMASLLISLACGIIGPLVVANRMVFISGGVAHAAYGGIGLAFFLGLSPLLGASLFSVLAAFILGILTLKNRHRRLSSLLGTPPPNRARQEQHQLTGKVTWVHRPSATPGLF